MGDIWRTFRVSVAAILVSAGLLTGWLALPRSVVACSCATNSLTDFARFPGVAVFTGTVGVRDAVGVPVVVDTWFIGPDIAPVVRLDPAYFGIHGESCQIAPPPPGTRWLFAGGRAAGTGLVQISLCSPHGDLSTLEGKALLAEAVKAFPNAQVPPTPTDVPTSAPAAPEVSAPAARSAPSPVIVTAPLSSVFGGIPPILAVGLLVLVAVGLVLLVVAVGRRLREPD